MKSIALGAMSFIGNSIFAGWFRYTSYFLLVGTFIIGIHLLFLYKATQAISNYYSNWFIEGYVLISGAFLLSRFLIVIFYTDTHRKAYSEKEYPSVSVIIAAKNEEVSIQKTLRTCLSSVYPGKMEVIAIDDGSTDATYREMCVVREGARNTARTVYLIQFKENLGKREALSAGISRATGDILVLVDSDSFPNPDAIQHVVEHFMEDEKVGAVAGNSIVENANVNFLTKMQSARYSISFDIFKACESVFSSVTCCPGCFSAYRRSAVLPILKAWNTQTFWGTKSTFGDDRSLTNHVLRNWKIGYCRHAIVRTIVPERFNKFVRQQLRWKKSWLREGSRAAAFFWRKNIIASLSFYTNLVIPIGSPVVVLWAVFIPIFLYFTFPTPFICGVITLGFLYSLYCFLVSGNRNWLYIIPFIFMYTVVLVWQMPYALLTIKDTRWGTR